MYFKDLSNIKKISKKDKGFIILQSDMPFVKTSDINKIYKSIQLPSSISEIHEILCI